MIRISIYLRSFFKYFSAPRRGPFIAVSIILLLGCMMLAMIKVKGAESPIDLHRLSGRLFFIQDKWSGDVITKRIVVMDANGSNKRILTEEVNPLIMWLSGEDSLGALGLEVGSDPFNSGLLTIKISGKSSEDTSVIDTEHPVPDDFRIHFYEPGWVFKDGKYVSDPNSRTYLSGVAFSPDGKIIAGAAALQISATEKYILRMCTVNADGSSEATCEELVEPHRSQVPAWSPDGTRVAFQGCLKGNKQQMCNLMELFIADANMKNVLQLTDINGPKFTGDEMSAMVNPGMKMDHWHKSSNPQWSPDGRWIAFMSYGGIYRVHPDGTGLQLIIKDGSFPTWSPDGTMLMYVQKTGSAFSPSSPSDHIYVAYADGSDQTEIPIESKEPTRVTYTDLIWVK